MRDEYTGITHTIDPSPDADPLDEHQEPRTLVTVRQSITNLAMRGMYESAKPLLDSMLFSRLAGFVSNRFSPCVNDLTGSADTTVRELKLHVMTQETYDRLLNEAHEAGRRIGLEQHLY